MSKKMPPQEQSQQPGIEHEMSPLPQSIGGHYQASNKLDSKIALITGGDSGIGKAVALSFAMEGADLAIVYLNETDDAQDTQQMIEKIGRRCLLIQGDLRDPRFCQEAIDKTIEEYGKLDIVVNNAGEQHVQQDFENISNEQMENTFRTNIFAYFYLTKAALPHLKKGSCIINTSSVTAYHGHPKLIDYSATKGAIVSFTRSLALNLAPKGIRVNGVAPGPIWTPLIPASFPAEDVESFGSNTVFGRPGQPKEVAPCYVFLASEDASFMTGQMLHPNGGKIING